MQGTCYHVRGLRQVAVGDSIRQRYPNAPARKQCASAAGFLEVVGVFKVGRHRRPPRDIWGGTWTSFRGVLQQQGGKPLVLLSGRG